MRLLVKYRDLPPSRSQAKGNGFEKREKAARLFEKHSFDGAQFTKCHIARLMAFYATAYRKMLHKWHFGKLPPEVSRFTHKSNIHLQKFRANIYIV